MNTAWRNASFRAFADYMLTDDFRDAVDELVVEARDTCLALMCAEAVPWRCHRSLVAVALTVRGVTVRDLLTPGRSQPTRSHHSPVSMETVSSIRESSGRADRRDGMRLIRGLPSDYVPGPATARDY